MKTLALAVTLLMGSALSMPYQVASTDSEKLPCKVEITLAKSSFGALEPVKITVTTTNMTDGSRSLGHDLSKEPQYDFDIRVRFASDGKLARLTSAGRIFVLKEQPIETRMGETNLAPGANLVESVDLRKLYDLDAGQYTVQLKQGKLQTNTVPFTVLPPQ